VTVWTSVELFRGAHTCSPILTTKCTCPEHDRKRFQHRRFIVDNQTRNARLRIAFRGSGYGHLPHRSALPRDHNQPMDAQVVVQGTQTESSVKTHAAVPTSTSQAVHSASQTTASMAQVGPPFILPTLSPHGLPQMSQGSSNMQHIVHLGTVLETLEARMDRTTATLSTSLEWIPRRQKAWRLSRGTMDIPPRHLW
jgi:hypothetical protein